MAEKTGVEQLAALGNAERPLFVYTVPNKGAFAGDAMAGKTVGLVELTLAEEMRGSSGPGSSATEQLVRCVIISLRMVDGARVNEGDGSADRAFASFSARVRALVTSAYQRMHGAAQSDVDGFINSGQIQA